MTMTFFKAAALSGMLATTACTAYSEAEVAGGLAGAGLGAITAQVLGADDDWTIIAALAGATAGTLVARNQQNRNCAYARGDGTYYTAACP